MGAREAVPYEIILAGTSWGGLQALSSLVSALPADFALPLVLVQHRHREANSLLSSLLQDRTSLPVCEVEDKLTIEPGTIYIAPADYHLLVERGQFGLTLDEPVRFSRPSIDVTFSSAADAYGRAAVGAVLTGANADGAAGLRRVADRGGLTLVQDPATAESKAMPEAAIRSVPTATVLALPELVRFIADMAHGNVARVRGSA
jgi:two-component system, chemotaxis family, protein-glutamate methylesterase/glutaminase